jgi:uncharacterized membrane protein YukC
MIHYEKTPDGDLYLKVSAEDVGEVYSLLESAALLQRRTFDGLKTLIKEEFSDELEQYRRRMTAQIPLREEGQYAAM